MLHRLYGALFSLVVLLTTLWLPNTPPAPQFSLNHPIHSEPHTVRPELHPVRPEPVEGQTEPRLQHPQPERASFLPSAAPSVHAPALAELPDGRIAAAWFAGSREGAGDVEIVLSHYDPKTDVWSAPHPIATREQTLQDTQRSVRKLGNPVLWTQGNTLSLAYVSAGFGGWAGSSINLSQSIDGGQHWNPARKLVTSPFFNLSTLVRTPPLPLADGSVGLPVYHELFTKQGEWLRLSPQGDVLDKTRMPLPAPSLQPAVATLDSTHALALLRDASPEDGKIQVATTASAGQHWQAGPPLPLGNPNASIALLRLDDGPLLLAANPGSGRDILELWLGDATGQHWEKRRIVDAPGQTAPPAGLPVSTDLSDALKASQEASYPALLQTRDGRIHLAYTWHRQQIRHLSFDRAWLGGKP